MIIQRGSRDKLEKFFDLNRPLKIILKTDGAATYDFCCFGVDADNKLSDDPDDKRQQYFPDDCCAEIGKHFHIREASFIRY